ncbi:hypothetical protein ACFX2J_031475 [Malus domestica]
MPAQTSVTNQGPSPISCSMEAAPSTSNVPGSHGPAPSRNSSFKSFMETATTTSLCTTSFSTHPSHSWSGNLVAAQFAWNHLPLVQDRSRPTALRIADFSRKWPIGTVPAGMIQPPTSTSPGTFSPARSHQICDGNKLQKLILFSNRFTDPLPKTLANCTSLFRLRIQNNQINGSVPTGFGSLPNLTFVDLSGNNFIGMIPEDLGNAEALSYLNILLNPLHSVLPSNIWRAPNLQIFSASSSHLTGKIPDFIGCQSLYRTNFNVTTLTARSHGTSGTARSFSA